MGYDTYQSFGRNYCCHLQSIRTVYRKVTHEKLTLTVSYDLTMNSINRPV